MKENGTMTGSRICPKCGKTYDEVPAVSRADGKTLICPDCGTREALLTIGVDTKSEQDRILAAIHRCRRSG